MKYWTEDEIEFLKICCEMGWVYKDISNELDRTKDAVQNKCTLLNISNNMKAYKKTTEQYILELKIKNPTMICLEKYKGALIPILHKCSKCGMKSKSTPDSKLSGKTCKNCGYATCGNGIPIDMKGSTYLIYIPEYDLYKLGITSRTIKRRMLDNNLKMSEYEIILERKFDKGIDAMNLEKQWKVNLEKYLINTGLLKSGNTETFRY